MNAVLEHRAVLTEMQPEAGLLALGAHARVGQPDRRHQIAMRRHRQHVGVDRSVLHANGAGPLTFWASATSTSHPGSSSVSRTNRAPVIDSITPRIRPCGPTRSTKRRSPSASGGAANCATTSPSSPMRHTSRRLRLRSESSMQHEYGPPRARSSVTRSPSDTNCQSCSSRPASRWPWPPVEVAVVRLPARAARLEFDGGHLVRFRRLVLGISGSGVPQARRRRTRTRG